MVGREKASIKARRRALVWTALASTCMLLPGCRGHEADARAKGLASKMSASVLTHPGFEHPMPYRLFVPPKATTPHPLIVTLHGAGGRGSDNLGQLDDTVAFLLSDKVQGIQPAFVLAPQCPKGEEWLDVKQSAPYLNYRQADVGESEESKLVLEIINQVLETYSGKESGKPRIDPKRIYITGYSMGGGAVWDLITRHPKRFAAAIPLTGISDPSQASRIVNLPIRAFHGRKDQVAPIANTRKMITAIDAARAKLPAKLPAKQSNDRRLSKGPVSTLTELDEGHGIVAKAYNTPGLFAWLFAQKRQ